MAIKAQITVDNSELKKGLKEAEGQASKSMNTVKKTVEGASTMFGKLASSANNASQAISTGMQGVTTTLSKLGPIGIAAAAGITLIGSATVGVFSLVNKLSNRLNDISKSAKSVNMTANQYLALQYASKRAGVAMEDVLSIISKTDQAMTKAAEGEAKYRDAFYALGLTWRELSKLSPEKQIMAVTEAFAKLNAEGRSAPSDVYSIYSRKDIRNLNKLSKEDVGRLVAEAGALGIKIDEEAIRTAEELQDIYGDINQKIIAWASNLKAAKDAMKEIKNIAKNASDFLGKDGEVLPEYSNIAESYITVAKRLTQSGKFSDEQMRDMVKASKLDLNPLTSAGLMQSGGYLAFVEQVNKEVAKMSKEDLQREMNNIKFDSMGNNLAKTVHKAVADIDKRFANGLKIAKNKDYTYQRSDEEIAASKVLDKAEDTNRELEKQIRYYDSISNKLGLEFNVERKIADLEAELAEKTKGRVMQLDESVKLTMKQNAALMKQKAIQAEIERLKKLGSSSQGKSYVELLSKAGANRTGLSQLNESLMSIGIDDGIANRFITDFSTRWMEAYTKKTGKFVPEISMDEMLKTDPQLYYDVLKESAEAFNTNESLAPVEHFIKGNKELHDAIKEYNKFAKNNNIIQTTDINEAIKALKPYEDNLEKIKQKEAELRELNKNDPTGSAGLKTQLSKDIFALQTPLKLLDRLNNAKNFIDQQKLINDAQQFMTAAQWQQQESTSMSMMKNVEALKRETDLSKALLSNNQKIVEELKRKQILEEAGISATTKNLKEYEKVLDIVIQAQQNSESTKIFKDYIAKGTELGYSLSKYSGDTLKANRELAVFNAQIQKGSLLTDEEKSLIERLSDLSTNADIIKMPSRLDDVIHTNELARRGGFSESVAVERRDNSEKIVEYLSKMQKLSTDIRKFVNDINDKCTINY